MSATTSSSAIVAATRISPSNCIFLLCDIQERFPPLIYKIPHVLHSAGLLLSARKILDIPLIVTEQYPKALGKTISSLDISDAKVFEKTKFSMLTDEVMLHLTDLKIRENRRSAILFGLEAHVCIQQTVLDLIEAGYSVHVIADAVSSQRALDRLISLKKMEKVGAILTTTESLLFELIRNKNHPHFKAISHLAKTPLPSPEHLFPPTL